MPATLPGRGAALLMSPHNPAGPAAGPSAHRQYRPSGGLCPLSGHPELLAQVHEKKSTLTLWAPRPQGPSLSSPQLHPPCVGLSASQHSPRHESICFLTTASPGGRLWAELCLAQTALPNYLQGAPRHAALGTLLAHNRLGWEGLLCTPPRQGLSRDCRASGVWPRWRGQEGSTA